LSSINFEDFNVVLETVLVLTLKKLQQIMKLTRLQKFMLSLTAYVVATVVCLNVYYRLKLDSIQSSEFITLRKASMTQLILTS
jgi:hypothetical protein